MAPARYEVGTDLRRFTMDYFTFFGGTVRPLDRRKQGPLEIELPGELVDYFGAPHLRVGFHAVTPGSDMELVAHGSRLFDRMLGLLDRRGALTVQVLPSRHTSSQELLAAIRPLNASIAELKMREETQSRYVFNWRITYRADDKREELYTVMLAENGERIPLADDVTAISTDKQDALTPGSRAGEIGANGTVSDANAGAASEPVALETLWTDATPLPVELDGNGEPLPPKLPPMTHLTRLAETARKYAIYHADVRCVSHEAEILPRLYKVLNRLTSYYSQQIEEVYSSHDPSGEKRRGLEIELERKLAEEVENHRLRVQVALFSYAIVQTPVAIASITLSDGQQSASVEVARDRYTGHIQTPNCYACGTPTSALALDRNGHICCDDCVCQCGTCQDILCASCGVEECPHCGKENCDQCGQLCWACGERACAEHVQRCPVCGDAVCLACQAPCAECGTLQCRSHLRADAVAAADGSHPLICADCAVRCRGCHQYSAQLGLCATSGQRFCVNCLVTCKSCGKQVGPGFYEQDPATGRTYCNDCLHECPACHALTTATLTCSECGQEGCASCMGRCDFCREPLCKSHLAEQAGCGHQLCSAHRSTCHLCQGSVCPVCFEPCAICEEYHCHDHVRICRRCDQVYCSECVHRSGLCLTCAALEDDGVPVQITQERWAKDEQVVELVPHYRWRRVGNARFLIFVGESSFLSRAVIVVRRSGKGGHVVLARRLGVDDRLRDIFAD